MESKGKRGTAGYDHGRPLTPFATGWSRNGEDRGSNARIAVTTGSAKWKKINSDKGGRVSRAEKGERCEG